MAHTVKQLAELSGVTVRTLHHYDEIGLLKPAYIGANGYRYYEEEQLLLLQQILFFREIGLSLKKIQQLLGRSDFNIVLALRAHRARLVKEQSRLVELVQTIDKTINRMTGEETMSDKELYQGFSPEKQAEYEKELIERFGESTRQHIETSKQRTQGWKDEEVRQAFKECEEIMRELVDLMHTHNVEDPAIQEHVRRHFEWLKRFWTPDRASYIGHSQLISDSELRAWYDKIHPELADYLACAIVHFSNTELN